MQCFLGNVFSWESGSFKGGQVVYREEGGRLGSWILIFLIQWIYAAMDLSQWNHVEMVQ